jgi:HPt (histidine-containing phosphotransfer) domain-containing protein
MVERIKVTVDPDLEDLIPGFLANRRSDVERLRELVERGDFQQVRLIGHGMKGSGGGYGFDPITDFGAQIEDAALLENGLAIEEAIRALADYLARVEPVFD